MCSTGGSENMGNTRVVDFDTLDENVKKLIQAAVEARKASYSPYSNFPVGACLQCEDDTLYGGCNVENALYGLSICAERTAIFKAVSEGKRKYKAIAVIAEQEKVFTTPCGPCRQAMTEFSKDITVYMTKPTLGKVLISTSGDLLPYSFGF